MKYKWLNKRENDNLIVFFNGWGMDESVVAHLGFEDYDVVMIYDYNSLDIDFSFLETYKQKYLVAWSMGVMTAALFKIDYLKKTAINGTLKPIDNEFGIPERIYNLTIRGFNEASCAKFISTMFNGESENITINRNFEDQKSELIALKAYKADPDFKYDRIILSDNDKIIPTSNQVKFWGIEPNLEAPHAPFNRFKFWSELL